MTPLVAGLLGLLFGLFLGVAFLYVQRGTHARRERKLELELADLRATGRNESEKLVWLDGAESKLREAFQALAGEALKSNSQAFTTGAMKGLSGVVDPLQEKLKALDGHVRELEKAREGAYRSLERQLLDLRTTHKQLHESTITLAQALRSPTVRGRWGELQLRRVVEMAGMQNHVSFREQVTTEQGRPDMTIALPNGGILPIDSKVPLSSYLQAMESQDGDERRRHLEAHAKAVRARVRELSRKVYWDQFESAPDLVVMFVPNEACLGAAFEIDPGLLEFAIDNKVMICTPVTLLALMRAVAYGWQQHAVTENAKVIATEGRELYGRLETFLSHYGSLGKSLQQAVERFNKTTGSLERRVMPSARRLREMGLSDKELETPAELDVVPSAPRGVEAPSGEPEPPRET